MFKVVLGEWSCKNAPMAKQTEAISTVPSGFCHRITDSLVKSPQKLRDTWTVFRVSLHFGLCGEVSQRGFPPGTFTFTGRRLYLPRESALMPQTLFLPAFTCRRRMRCNGTSFGWMERALIDSAPTCGSSVQKSRGNPKTFLTKGWGLAAMGWGARNERSRSFRFSSSSFQNRDVGLRARSRW